MTALSLVWPSPDTTLYWPSAKPVFFMNSGQIWLIESPGVMATVLPMMSLGVFTPFSVRPMTDIGLTCSATPTALTGAPFVAARIIVGTST